MAGSADHPDRGHQTRHALTFNPDHLVGAGHMATGVVPANSYHVLLDANGEVVWETVTNGQTVRYQDEPDTDFRRRFVADLWKVLPIESQL